jgi:TonB system transport protein ExbD (group 1)
MAARSSTKTARRAEENHEINVTPFIDVMLVLLIIFMVAAPLATVDVPVDLPARRRRGGGPTQPLYLTVKDDLTLTLGEDKVSREALAQPLDAATGGDKDERIFLRADKAVPYGEADAEGNDEPGAARSGWRGRLSRRRRPRSRWRWSAPTWKGLLFRHLQRHKRYPEEARRARQQGVAYVRFVMGRDGRVLSARLERSAGSALLDQAAMDWLQRAQPLPPLPMDQPGESIEIIVPFQFMM